MSCVITASWSMSAKTRCMSQCAADLRCVQRLENRMKCSAGSIPAVADWICGCAWCFVLIKCLGGGALTICNYFHFSDKKMRRRWCQRELQIDWRHWLLRSSIFCILIILYVVQQSYLGPETAASLLFLPEVFNIKLKKKP